MAGVEQGELLIDAVRSYPCIYDVRNGEFKVTLVKENAWKAIADTLQRTMYAWHCASFASVVGTAEAGSMADLNIIF